MKTAHERIECMRKMPQSRAREVFITINRSPYCRLSDVYNSYSSAKEYAYEYCEKLFAELDGRNFTITGANSMAFSVGFEFAHPETGELCVAFITKDNDWYGIVPVRR